MRAYLISLGLIVLGLLCGGCGNSETKPMGSQSASETSKAPIAKTPIDLVAKMHFVGTATIIADTNATRLKEIAGLPETAVVRTQTLQRLATAPYRLLQKKLAPDSQDEADLIQPMIEELFKNETYVEVRGTNPIPELILAVHLSNEQAETWRTNLSTILSRWTGLPVKNIEMDGFKGWELKKHENPDVIHFVRAGEWVVFGWGQGQIGLEPGMIERIKKDGRPVAVAADHWLNAWIDWSALRSHLTNSIPGNLPKTDIKLTGTNNYIRTMVTMDFPKALDLVLEPWQVPTNFIHDPVVSFTALRGIGPWLEQLKEVQSLKLETMPNQYYLWAMAKIPFETSFAAPVKDGTNFFTKVSSNLVTKFSPSLKERGIGQLDWDTNQNRLTWSGLPMLSPYLKLYTDSTGEYIRIGCFPSPMRKTPLPAELINELTSRTNLVYYDWEITQERLPQVRSLAESFYIVSGAGLAGSDAPTQKWLDEVAPKLGNCGTVVTTNSPQQLTLIRNSPIGFTAFELTMLKRWLDSPEFPLSTKLEKTVFRPGSLRPVAPGISVPPPAANTNQTK